MRRRMKRSSTGKGTRRGPVTSTRAPWSWSRCGYGRVWAAEVTTRMLWWWYWVLLRWWVLRVRVRVSPRGLLHRVPRLTQLSSCPGVVPHVLTALDPKRLGLHF